VKVFVYPHEVQELTEGIGRRVGTFLRDRDLCDEGETYVIAKKITSTVEAEIYSALGIAGKL
jgi:hypothetical protein